jgi:hypothetical protein
MNWSPGFAGMSGVRTTKCSEPIIKTREKSISVTFAFRSLAALSLHGETIAASGQIAELIKGLDSRVPTSLIDLSGFVQIQLFSGY